MIYISHGGRMAGTRAYLRGLGIEGYGDISIVGGHEHALGRLAR